MGAAARMEQRVMGSLPDAPEPTTNSIAQGMAIGNLWGWCGWARWAGGLAGDADGLVCGGIGGWRGWVLRGGRRRDGGGNKGIRTKAAAMAGAAGDWIG